MKKMQRETSIFLFLLCKINAIVSKLNAVAFPHMQKAYPVPTSTEAIGIHKSRGNGSDICNDSNIENRLI